MFSCTKEDPNEINDSAIESVESQKLLSVEELNAYIADELKTNGDLDWFKAPATVLWSAAVHGGNVISIGYGEPGQSFSLQRSPQLISARNNIIEIISNTEQQKSSDVVKNMDETLNFVDVTVEDFNTILALQKSKDIRYIDTFYTGYLQENEVQQKDFGCAQSGENINGSDYRVISPNSWLPWNFDIHKFHKLGIIVQVQE